MSISQKAFNLAQTSLGDLIVGLVFGRFSKLLPVNRIKENDKAVAFWHPKPFYEKHIIIVPKKSIKSITRITKDDALYIVEVFNIARDIVKELNWEKEGYSIICNGGNKQKIQQIHFHLFCGEKIENNK